MQPLAPGQRNHAVAFGTLGQGGMFFPKGSAKNTTLTDRAEIRIFQIINIEGLLNIRIRLCQRRAAQRFLVHDSA